MKNYLIAFVVLLSASSVQAAEPVPVNKTIEPLKRPIVLAKLPPPSTGKRYDLKLNLMIDGKSVLTPSFPIRLDERATALQNGNSGEDRVYLTVLAKEKSPGPKPELYVFCEVGSLSSNNEKKVFSTPQVVVHENETASIRTTDKDGRKIFITVIANAGK